MINVLAIIPVHNRRDITLEMLSSLEGIERPAGVSLSVCVIDDGSSDGTSEAIRREFSNVRLEKADGNLFWSGAVRHGIDLFLASDNSHLWLLNDDMVLDPQCLSRLVTFVRTHDPWVMSATVLDQRRRIIYGGIKRLPFFRFRKVTEEDFADGICRPEAVNGNCLLVSRTALDAFRLPPVGLYRQEAMDMYLGLEATRLGHMPYVLRDALCFASPNEAKMWFYKSGEPLSKRLRAIVGPKGLPPAMYWDFCRRFAGPIAPLVFIRPFLRVLFPRIERNP